MDNIWHIILIFAAFGGFLLAFYIRHKKQAHEKIVCLLNSDCDAVIIVNGAFLNLLIAPKLAKRANLS